MPDGTGRVNPRGLGFYDALVDALLDAGIAPLCNLYVFDHPVELEDRGGWLNRDMATWFGDYSAIVYERLGDRVEYWTTMCEPRFLSHVGHAVGAHLPGKSDISAGMRALHHLLLGQGHAVEAFRASGAAGRIGGQRLVIPVTAASDGERDLAAERTAAYFNAIQDRDLKTIVAPVDFLGVDYYLRLTVK